MKDIDAKTKSTPITASNDDTGTTYKQQLREFFHSKLFHSLLSVLITIDLCIVILDIVVVMMYCQDIPHSLEELLHDLSFISITILSIFIVELCLQMYVFGVCIWMKDCLHIFDLIIVVSTWAMEIAFHGNAAAEGIAGVFIGFRLWRLVRVVHVTTEALELQHEEKKDELLHEIESLEKEIEEHKLIEKSDAQTKIKMESIVSNSSTSKSEVCRQKLRHFFHSTLFHYLLGIFLAIDLVIVMFDIILILVYCDGLPHHLEELIHNLMYISICILGVFIIELSLQMYAFGAKEWLSECLHAFDFVIVLTTFIMEIVMHQNDRVQSMVGLLIVFRLWRLVRVIHVTTEALDLQYETELDELRDKIENLKNRVNNNEKQKLID